MSFLGVGASEAMLVVIIALIVIGPNRFPEAMRTAGRWYRMARAYSNEVMKDVRAAVDDIEREVNTEAEELKTVREMTDISGDLREAQRDAAEVLGDTDRALNAPAASDAPPPTTSKGTTAAPSATSAEVDTTPRPIRPSQRPAEKPAASTSTTPKTAAPEQAPSFDPFKQPKGGRRPSRATSSSSSTPRTTPTPATEAADAPDTAGTSSDSSGDNPA